MPGALGLLLGVVLVVVLLGAVARGVVGVEHVDELVRAAERRDRVEGALVLVHLGQDERLLVEVLQLVVGLIEVEGHRVLPAELLVGQRHYLLEGAVLDLQEREVLDVPAQDLAALLLPGLLQPAAQVLLVGLDEPLLVGEVGLFELVAGVAAPVHGLLVDRDVDEVLVELHHQHLIIVRVGLEVVGQFAGGAAVAVVDALGEEAVEGVELGAVEDLAA